MSLVEVNIYVILKNNLNANKKVLSLCHYIAGWSSWQLVGLITQRSEVRVLLPLLKGSNHRFDPFLFCDIAD